LAGMRERAALAGGTLSFDSGKNGTLLRARLPISQANRVPVSSRSEQAAS
jgi:signal transduction histidine kinase